jgi:hypothetical protein
MIERDALVQIDRTIALFGLDRYQNTLRKRSPIDHVPNLHHFTVHDLTVSVLRENKITNLDHSAPTFLFVGYFFDSGSSSLSIHESFRIIGTLEGSDQLTRPAVRIVLLTIYLEQFAFANQNQRFHFLFPFTSYIDIILGVLELSREKSGFLCQEILTQLFTIFCEFGTRFAGANIMPNLMARDLLLRFNISRCSTSTYVDFAGAFLS